MSTRRNESKKPQKQQNKHTGPPCSPLKVPGGGERKENYCGEGGRNTCLASSVRLRDGNIEG